MAEDEAPKKKEAQPGKKNPVGRPRIEDSKPKFWEQVDALCQIQCTNDEIAAVLECTMDTLTHACQRVHGINFYEYSKAKREGGKSSLRRLQWLNAKGGNVTMQIWLGKQMLKQSDKREDKVESHVKAEIKGELDVSKLSTEELLNLQALMKKCKGE